MEDAFKAGLLEAHAPDAVFDDDHRAVDDDAEVDGAQAEQVAADFMGHHAGDGEQHGQGNHQCGDERRAKISQQQKQHQNDEQGPFGKVIAHGFQRRVDQFGAVVHDVGLDACGQGAVDFLHLLRHTQRNRPAVFALQHEHRAENRFPAVFGGRAGAQFFADVHVRHVVYMNRNPAVGADHDL